MAASIQYKASKTPRDEAILVQFTNGRLKVDSQGCCSDPLQFGYYANANADDARKKNQRILAAETSSMQYVGYNYGRNAPRSNSACKYMLGVLDKKSGKMQVYDAQYFTMRPNLPEDEEDAEPTERRELTLAEKTDNLTEAFGGAKKKRAMELRIRNKLGQDELDQVMGTAVKLAKEQPGRSVQNDGDSESSAVTFLPPFDKTASKPEEIFKFDDIISPSHLEMLKQPAKVFVEATKEEIEEWKSNSQYPLYILSHLSVLPSNSEHREHTACCLMYLRYLLSLFHTKAKDLQKKVLFPEDIPKSVKFSILHDFTITANDPTSPNKTFRYIPARVKDKLLSYIIILCLHIDEFELSLNQLQKDLKMTLRKFLGHVNTMGCKVKTRKITLVTGSDTERIATLPVPFKIPEKIQRGKKRNRDEL